jgi:c(7)-type cytochrome triheme protein
MKLLQPKPRKIDTNPFAVWLTALCVLSVVCISVVTLARQTFAERQRTQATYREFALLLASPQGTDLDYSNFKHSSQKHASLSCTSCHQRKDNSATPIFPGHKACMSCHLAQFLTPNVPMCVICHSDVNSSKPPLKSFPTRFSESFNVKFDHAQHMNGAARPASGCAACHSRSGRAAAALNIPTSISAHSQCYTCHTPSSRSQAGREIASCGVCHEQKSFSRTTTNARSFRYAFSHARHGPSQKLDCVACHQITPGAAQSRQVSSPVPLEHFATARGKTCLTCHNGQRSFGGDLAFRECRRCHTSSSFKMPM